MRLSKGELEKASAMLLLKELDAVTIKHNAQYFRDISSEINNRLNDYSKMQKTLRALMDELSREEESNEE